MTNYENIELFLVHYINVKYHLFRYMYYIELGVSINDS